MSQDKPVSAAGRSNPIHHVPGRRRPDSSDGTSTAAPSALAGTGSSSPLSHPATTIGRAVVGPHFSRAHSRARTTAPAGGEEHRLSDADREITRLLALERIRNQHHAYQHPSYIMEQRLTGAISRGESSRAMDILDQINSLERATLADNPLRSLKNSLIASCTFMTRAAISGGVDSESAFMLSDIYIRSIEQLNSRPQAESLEYDMVLGFCSLVQTAKQQPASPLVARARNFIRENIQHRLTLGEIADSVGVNPNYLSTTFSQETGQPVMSFYDQERCAAISEFLRNTDLSIGDISEVFEFNSLSHFSTYFKKVTGLSPSECRRQC